MICFLVIDFVLDLNLTFCLPPKLLIVSNSY